MRFNLPHFSLLVLCADPTGQINNVNPQVLMKGINCLKQAIHFHSDIRLNYNDRDRGWNQYMDKIIIKKSSYWSEIGTATWTLGFLLYPSMQFSVLIPMSFPFIENMTLLLLYTWKRCIFGSAILIISIEQNLLVLNGKSK